MASPQVPKYQAIHAVLRQRILDGEYAAGSKLPPQQELADEFGVTIMTLRQALANLDAEGLVWAARGKGTFVADRPVDISVGNLSSFAEQMRSAGVAMATDLLRVDVVAGADAPNAAAALESANDDLICITRRRRADGASISVQRSYLVRSVGVAQPGESLYETIEAATGWLVAEARESITAVQLDAADAALLDCAAGHPAILSLRTSINQFGRPFLYDEALLVGGRCWIAADRTSDRLSLEYGLR